jgi:hypothetical protein
MARYCKHIEHLKVACPVTGQSASSDIPSTILFSKALPLILILI